MHIRFQNWRKNMRKNYKLLFAALGVAFATQASAEFVLFGQEGFQGRSFTVTRNYNDLERTGFNDRASSALITNDRWEVCEHARFEGSCRILRPGRYPSLEAMGIGNAISSVRKVSREVRVEPNRYAPQPYPVYDARRRKDERTFQADVTAVRGVYGQQQRCWVEREQVAGRDTNIGGAVAGAVIGGILGHQVGSGRGNDVATALGALAGGAVGSQVGNGGPGYTRDVRRCDNVPTSGRPDYWDVTYVFKGQEHHMQTANPPGRTVLVNGRGEPRV
jgi:uncharacterized protein YcfJ